MVPTLVQYLISKRVDLDAGDGHMVTALHLSAISNKLSTTVLLLDAGANLTRQDNEGDQPLHWAATRGHIKVDLGSTLTAWTALAPHCILM
jgi:ankyrin repeat protein